MITDEQVCIACAAYDSIDVAHSQLTAMRKALEAYEQSKPKPEPYRYISKNTGECVLPHELPDDLKINGRWLPLYTTPPTRDPLSEEFLMALAEECTAQFFNGVRQNATIHFARAVEKDHGIGVE